MLETKIGNALVQHPEGTRVVSAPATGVGRRGEAREVTDPSTAALLRGLATSHEVGLSFSMELEATAASAPTVRRRALTSGRTSVVLEVGPEENAALLLEEAGAYRWIFPTGGSDAPGQRRSGRKDLLFDIAPRRMPSSSSGRRDGLSDLLGQVVFDRVRVFVIKLAAKAALNAAQHLLESRLEPGLLALDGNAPETWHPNGRVRPLSSEPARILLFIHGTFSSTAGSFGALSATPEGRAFLAKARKTYDALWGFDHRTLGDSPEANARDILEALEEAARNGAVIDIVAYSRGGLVARVLVEELLRNSDRFRVGKVAFVAATNSGTALADQTNWHAFLDLYTNLAVAAGNVLTLLGSGVAGLVISESVRALGDFAQAVVDVAVREAMVPGIAGMSRSSPLVKRLNEAAPPAAAASYFSIGSDFDGRSKENAIPVLLSVAELAADGLMLESNDLVVNTAAMTSLGRHLPWLDGQIIWDRNASVYHTNYFAQPAVALALSGWLFTSLDEVGLPAKSGKILSADADATVRSVREALGGAPATDVVFLDWPSRQRRYVRRVGQILLGIRGASEEQPVGEALGLRETQEAATTDSPEVPPLISANGYLRFDDGVVTEAMPALLPPVPEPGRQGPRRGEETLGTINLEGMLVRGMEGEDDALEGYEEPSIPVATDEQATCYFGAQMPGTVEIRQIVPLRVTLSREQLAIIADATHRSASGSVRVAEPIELEVIPRRNCTLMSEALISAAMPDPGKPTIHEFRVRGIEPGPAELCVDARQGDKRLVRMVLQPTFIETQNISAVDVVDARAKDLPTMELRIFERAEGPDDPFSLHFVLTSRDLDLHLEHETAKFPMARQPYIRSLYERLEGDWGEHGAEFDAFMGNLQVKGAELYQTLIPEPVRAAIWKHQNDIGSIEVVSHEPFIPWEVLHIVEPGKKLPPGGNRFLAELGVVRWVSNSGFPPSNLRIRRGRSHYVIPDYLDLRLRLPEAAKERKLLVELFDATPIEASSSVVRDRLSKGEFDLLHFACHGGAETDRIWDASLLMQGFRKSDGSIGADRMDAATVEQCANLRHANGQRPVVFLNACQVGKSGRTLTGTGGLAEAFVRSGAGLLISALWSVGDLTASSFCDHFYKELKNGRTVASAIAGARAAARANAEPTWLAYVVYGHPYARLHEEDRR